MKKIICFAICCFCFLKPSAAFCEEMPSDEFQELRRMVQELKTVVDRQELEIARLKERLGEGGQPSGVLAPDSNVSRSVRGRWNPDIGVVADVVAALDSPREDTEGSDRVSVRELEIIFGSDVDPFSRFDVTLVIADFENMAIEEAYLTRFDLPLEFTARLGRFLPRIGKAISIHRDGLDTVDEPMVVEKYFGHHGYNKTGVDLTRPLELPWAMTHQLTFGVLEGGNGEEGTLFGDTRRHPTLYSHLKNYIDLSDVTGFELGLSHLVGSRDDDSTFEVNVIGLDGTLIHRYADQRHIKLQAESFFVSRDESFYEFTDDATGEITQQDLDDARHLHGAYCLADWKFHSQWATGFRYDNVQLIETAADFANLQSNQEGYTGYLTFYQSEFARWRVQVSHIDLTNENDDDRVFVQGVFAIGEHKHKLQ